VIYRCWHRPFNSQSASSRCDLSPTSAPVPSSSRSSARAALEPHRICSDHRGRRWSVFPAAQRRWPWWTRRSCKSYLPVRPVASVSGLPRACDWSFPVSFPSATVLSRIRVCLRNCCTFFDRIDKYTTAKATAREVATPVQVAFLAVRRLVRNEKRACSRQQLLRAPLEVAGSGFLGDTPDPLFVSPIVRRVSRDSLTSKRRGR
jgi:hypothetical protein